MNAIELKQVRKNYPGFTLDNLTLSVPEGSICGLAGENGAGKSTAIRLLMGAIRRDGGTAAVLGTDPASAAFRDTKEDIGVVLEESYFPETLTAIQMEKVLSATYRRWSTEQFHAFLERFDLPPKKPFKAYSRGMRMKLGIAAALSHHAKLLVLDEATAGLDPVVRDEVLELFRDFAGQEDHTVLLSSHILSDLEKLCDSVAFLHQGRLLFHQDTDSLLEEYGIFHGTEEQADSLLPKVIVGRERSQYGGVRALVRRSGAPSGLDLERPSIEDVILFTVKGVKQA